MVESFWPEDTVQLGTYHHHGLVQFQMPPWSLEVVPLSLILEPLGLKKVDYQLGYCELLSQILKTINKLSKKCEHRLLKHTKLPIKRVLTPKRSHIVFPPPFPSPYVVL